MRLFFMVATPSTCMSGCGPPESGGEGGANNIKGGDKCI